MQAEGMVHALELVHSLLVPQGILIDIHPTVEPPPIEIILGGKIYSIGNLQETDDFIEYAQADAALAQANHTGLFTSQRHANFTFLTHADSLEELRHYLEENWSDSVWPDEVNRRAAHLYTRTGQRETRATLRENIHITRLRRLSLQS